MTGAAIGLVERLTADDMNVVPPRVRLVGAEAAAERLTVVEGVVGLAARRADADEVRGLVDHRADALFLAGVEEPGTDVDRRTVADDVRLEVAKGIAGGRQFDGQVQVHEAIAHLAQDVGNDIHVGVFFVKDADGGLLGEDLARFLRADGGGDHNRTRDGRRQGQQRACAGGDHDGGQNAAGTLGAGTVDHVGLRIGHVGTSWKCRPAPARP